MQPQGIRRRLRVEYGPAKKFTAAEPEPSRPGPTPPPREGCARPATLPKSRTPRRPGRRSALRLVRLSKNRPKKPSTGAANEPVGMHLRSLCLYRDVSAPKMLYPTSGGQCPRRTSQTKHLPLRTAGQIQPEESGARKTLRNASMAAPSSHAHSDQPSLLRSGSGSGQPATTTGGSPRR